MDKLNAGTSGIGKTKLKPYQVEGLPAAYERITRSEKYIRLLIVGVTLLASENIAFALMLLR